MVNGFIESSPIIEEQDKVSLSIVPLTALIDTQLGDKGIGQCSLLDGFHYYGVNGNHLEYGLYSWHKTLGVVYDIDQTSTITASTLSLLKNGAIMAHYRFDLTLPNGSADNNAIRQPHPRYPLLVSR